jgi:hypothetical protein
MKREINSRSTKLLRLMKIISWIVFFGLLIKAGSILVSYLISTINPNAAKNLYEGLDLSAYLNAGFINYTCIVMYRVIIIGLQAYIALLLTKLLSRVNFLQPFSSYVVLMMQIMSYTILGIGVFVIIYNIHVGILDKIFKIAPSYISGEFLFLAGIVYIFAQMFRRGVEIQRENELTV